MARSEPMADASLPDIRARSKPGTAIAAMIPMIATTISSSINVKPLVFRMLMSLLSLSSIRCLRNFLSNGYCRNEQLVAAGSVAHGVLAVLEQPLYHQAGFG